MSRKRAALGLLCAAALAGAPAPSVAQVPTDAPRISYRHRTLPNGLQFYSVLDRSTPTVTVQARYRFGGRDDPPGQNGLGHLIEHLMFQGSRNVAPSGIIYLAEDAGWPNYPGSQSNNDYDALQMYQTLASNSLERFLWAEADRLRGLVVTDSLLELERAAVVDEIRETILERPYGTLPRILARESFARHGYRLPESGTVEEVNRLTLDQVRAAVARYFRPDNVVLVVVGDFEPAQLDGWVDRYFGSIPRPTAPLERLRAEEPARTADRRVTEYARVPTPAVGLAFTVPGASDADIFPLRVARQLMTGGTGRLVRTLAQSASATSGSVTLTPMEEPSIVALTAYGAQGSAPDTLERLLRTTIAGLRDEPPADAELERAKTALIAEFIRGLDSNLGKADALGVAVVRGHDPEQVNTTVQRIRAVTAADVQRVMRRYAADGSFVVLHYLPLSARPAQGTAARTNDDQGARGAREGGNR